MFSFYLSRYCFVTVSICLCIYLCLFIYVLTLPTSTSLSPPLFRLWVQSYNQWKILTYKYWGTNFHVNTIYKLSCTYLSSFEISVRERLYENCSISIISSFGCKQELQMTSLEIFMIQFRNFVYRKLRLILSNTHACSKES